MGGSNNQQESGHPPAVVRGNVPLITRGGGKKSGRTSLIASKATVAETSNTQNTTSISTPGQSQHFPSAPLVNKGVTNATGEEDENDVKEDNAEYQNAQEYQAEEDNNTTVQTSPGSNPQPTRRYPARKKSVGLRTGFSAVNTTPRKRTSAAEATTPDLAQAHPTRDSEDGMDIEQDTVRNGTPSTGGSEGDSPAPTTSSTGAKSTPRKKAPRRIEQIIDHKLSLENLGADYNMFDLLVKWNNSKTLEWWLEDNLWDEHKADILKYWGVDSEKRRRALTKIPTEKRRNGWVSRIDRKQPVRENEDGTDMSVTAWGYVLEYVGYPADVSELLTYHELAKRAPRLIKEYAKKEGLVLPGK